MTEPTNRRLFPTGIRADVTAAICRALGHEHPRINNTASPAEHCLDGVLADAALSFLSDPDTFKEIEKAGADRLHAIEPALAREDPEDRHWMRARAVLIELRMLVGHGTPTMQGQYCQFEFPDETTCIFGVHHTVGYHQSTSGQRLNIEGVR
jgi:hypothetical protein